jgi:5-methylcytosine-specific restriction endonuclease McrA
MKKNKRKAISNKVRFEVFKRDKMACQYCGQSFPNVVLHLDHIHPVAKGGGNDLLNLITSCFECNSGKSDRTLDDDTVVVKQRQQLEMLQERREQIALMFEWRKELDQIDGGGG